MTHMYLLSKYQWQCQVCVLDQVSEPLLLVILKHPYNCNSFFAPSSLCVWNQMPWRNLQTIVLPRVFSCTYSVDDLAESQNLWSCWLISLNTNQIFVENFLISDYQLLFLVKHYTIKTDIIRYYLHYQP